MNSFPAEFAAAALVPAFFPHFCAVVLILPPLPLRAAFHIL